MVGRSNRGDDSLAVFSVVPADGRLGAAVHVPVGGKYPRHFTIDPTGRWLLAAHQNSGTIAVFRLDPASGRERWAHDPQVPRTSARPYRCRGVAYAEAPQVEAGGACRHRIYTATNDRRLISLDARDGRPCAGFGANGVVDLVEHERYGLEQVGTSSPPVVGNGVVVVGSSVIDFAYAEAPRGVIAAYDAVTGASRWGRARSGCPRRRPRSRRE